MPLRVRYRSKLRMLISTSNDLCGEAVLERELETIVVCTEAVGKILALGPLELGSHHHVLDRRAHQVRRGVLADFERISRLEVAVLDVEARVPRCRRPLAAPVVIEVHDEPD